MRALRGHDRDAGETVLLVFVLVGEANEEFRTFLILRMVERGILGEEGEESDVDTVVVVVVVLVEVDVEIERGSGIKVYDGEERTMVDSG